MNAFDREKFDWVEHLEELRGRLFVVIGAVLLASLAGYFFSEVVFRLLLLPLHPLQERLYFMSPYEAFIVKLTVSLFSGLLLSAPVILTQTWLFVAPGLYEREKKALAFIVGLTLVFFLVGVFFAFFLVAPFALRFFLGFQSENLKPLLSVKEYICFLTSFLLAFGVAFDFPVLLLGLVKLGLIRAETLAKQRRLAVVLIFVLAAVLTPSTDVISQTLLAVPLIVLFEASVFIARRIEKSASRHQAIST